MKGGAVVDDDYLGRQMISAEGIVESWQKQLKRLPVVKNRNDNGDGGLLQKLLRTLDLDSGQT